MCARTSPRPRRTRVRRILTDKGFQNTESARRHCAAVTADLLGKATLIVNGQELDVKQQRSSTRIVHGFHELLVRTYPNLRMLRGVTYTENDIGSCLQHGQHSCWAMPMPPSAKRNRRCWPLCRATSAAALRTTLQIAGQRFERKPYGWYLAAIQCIAGQVDCARGKVEVRRDGTSAGGESWSGRCAIRTASPICFLSRRSSSRPPRCGGCKDFYADFFDGPPQANEAKALGTGNGSGIRNAATRSWSELRLQAEHLPIPHALVSADGS